MTTLNYFLAQLTHRPDTIEFTDTIAIIDEHYTFTPTAFNNGNIVNKANQNNASCKIFSFGLLNKLNPEQTLACFGVYYRDDVLQNPNANDHQNIRNFMVSGWQAVQFERQALTLLKV